MKIYVYYIFQFIFVYIFNPLCITILLSGDILYKSMFFFDFIKFLFTFSYFATFVWKKNRRKGTQGIWNWICTVIRKYLWATFQRSLIPPLHFPYIFFKAKHSFHWNLQWKQVSMDKRTWIFQEFTVLHLSFLSSFSIPRISFLYSFYIFETIGNPDNPLKKIFLDQIWNIYW